MAAREARMSGYQLAMLLIPGIASTAFLGLPASTAAFAMQDAWLAPFAALPATALTIWIACRLAAMFPGESFAQYAPKVLGRIPGKVATFLLFWYFFHLGAAIAREFGDFLVATTLPRTPVSLILGVTAAVTALAVRSGPEILGRIGELFTPIAVVMILVVIAMAYSHLDFTMLQPVLEHGLRPVLTSGFLTQAFLGQFVLLVVLLPSVNQLKEGIRASYFALAFVCLSLSLVSAVAIASFGPITPRFTWPFFKVARMASIGPVLARIDPLVIGFWIGGTCLKYAVHLYGAVLCFAQGVGLSNWRALSLPMSALITAYAIGHFDNFVEHIHMLAYFWPPYTQLFQLLIPALVLVVAQVRRPGVVS